MARSTNRHQKSTQTKGQETPKKHTLLWLWMLLSPIGGGAVGLFAQDYFDVLKTNRELAVTYQQQAAESSDKVEDHVAKLVKLLSDPSSTIPDAQKAGLRESLLGLQKSAKRLQIQAGIPDPIYLEYERAMADLAHSVDEASGPADADPVIEALSNFYMSKQEFDKSVARKYRPLLDFI